VVRRRFVVDPGASSRVKLTAEHTAALIQVFDVGAQTAVARVVYVCDEIAVGDHVEPFHPEPTWSSDFRGTPDFDQAARILFADEGRTVGAPAELMVIDRGRNHGAYAGQRLTMFPGRSAAGVTTALGEAIVVAVQAESATIRIEKARDAIRVGDAAVLHR
jgi:hypothetical protein